VAQLFKLPDLGEGLHEAEIREVLVSVGDTVTEGETVLRVETDKATVDVPSPYDGTVQEIKAQAGDVVAVGAPLIIIGDGASEEEAEPAAEEAEAEAEQPDQPAKKAEPPQQQTPAADGERPVPASPATRRLARELDVDLQRVEGSGPGGRVTSEDVRSFAEEGPEPEAKAPEGAEAEEKQAETAERSEPALPVTAPKLPDFTRWGTVERVPLRSVRRTTAQRMAQSWTQIPHVSHHDTADITELEQLRQETAVALERDNLTLTIFVLKAAVAALQDRPRFNASLDIEAGEIVLKQYYHVGVAVDTDQGLVVPVLRDVDGKAMLALADEFEAAVSRTRAGETTIEDVQGGTFTITNVGVLGGTHFNPIINYPQVAILGMARADWQPVVRVTEETGKKQIEPRLRLPLILAFDHRVVDGADAARFMNQVVALLENPRRLLVNI
jgi:pyruvate dehydrogenase E2 component (dihydrolipoamide acetyltransferase)